MVEAIRRIKMMICVVSLGFMANTHAADVYVFANSIASGSKLSYSDVEDIFTLRNRRWDNGVPIRVFLLPRDNPLTKWFSVKYLNMTANRYYDIIESRESVGKGNIFVTVNTEIDIMTRVLTTPGSIGYASDAIVLNFDGNVVIVK